MTNAELGDLIGVSPSMASRIRNGHRLPSTGVIRRISVELEIPIDQLLEAHGEGPTEFGRLMRMYLDEIVIG